jgi:beta-galactosidase
MVNRIRLMNEWHYCRAYVEGMERDERLGEFTRVALPHANEELPFNYFDEKRFQFVSCYRKILPEVPLSAGQRAVVRFEGVMAAAKAYVNGTFIGSHDGGYTPFEFDVSSFLRAGGRNVLYVVVDSRELEHIPPFGGQIDYLTYGGIYRDVTLDVYEAVHLRNVRAICPNPLAAGKSLDLALLTGNGGAPVEATLRVSLSDFAGKKIASFEQNVSVPAGDGELAVSFGGIHGAALWTPDSPVLYALECELAAGGASDSFRTRIGFRTAEFRNEGFFLNGEPLKLCGLNRHQSWPYVGYAMPKRAQRRDADILKNELRVNVVRASHYPQSPDFLDRCDEIGLLVFEELPGWQHIGGAAWKDLAVENVREMIVRDWNHPSIVIWGVRINESQDDDPFYGRTTALARALDPSRQTGGVRYFSGSHLLEDVYTKNDFTQNGGGEIIEDSMAVTRLDRRVPYLITEYNGHMYPTKKYDCEERQSEFVLRHLRVQNAMLGDPWISGAIGWCMFDYNTHHDFGAGDRICYHGVMDMFRIPKFAAWAYASQVDPAKEVVLKPVTWWARGERSVCTIFPLVILTNCDELAVEFGKGEAIRLSGKDRNLSNLPYPPFIITEKDIGLERLGSWGQRWEDVKITGFIDGETVAVREFSRNPVPSSLSVTSDDAELAAGEKDVTRFVVKVLDQLGNELPFCDTILDLSITGPARIQGPDRLVVKGGSAGFWIESDGTPGTVSMSVFAGGLTAQTVTVRVS